MLICTGGGAGAGAGAGGGAMRASGGGGAYGMGGGCGAIWLGAGCGAYGAALAIGGSVGKRPEALGEEGFGLTITGCSTDVNSGGAIPRRSAVSASSTRADASSIVRSFGSHDSTRCST